MVVRLRWTLIFFTILSNGSSYAGWNIREQCYKAAMWMGFFKSRSAAKEFFDSQMNKQDPRSQYSPYVRSYTGVQGGVELLYPPNAARRETFFPEKSVAVRKKFEVEPTEMVSYVKMLETQRALAAA